MSVAATLATLALALLGYACIAKELPTIRSDTTRGLVRRHTSVRMEATGELVQDVDDVLVAARRHQHLDKCRIAFEYGALDANNCTHDDSELIFDEAVCTEAAKEMNFGLEPDREKIPWNYFDKFPKGCFHRQCNESSSGCLFFNPDGDNPMDPKGLPVCSFPRYAYGEDGSEKCPDRYEPMSRDACQGAAMCLGDEEDADFEIQLEDQHKYVPGCSLHNITGFLRVHWNAPMNGTSLLTTPDEVEAKHDKLDEAISAVPNADESNVEAGAQGSSDAESSVEGASTQVKEGVVVCRAPNMTTEGSRVIAAARKQMQNASNMTTSDKHDTR